MNSLHQKHRVRLQVEGLEDRLVPAAPSVMFYAEELGGNQIRIVGTVGDEDPTSVAVAFSGVATGQVSADETGYFSFNTTATELGPLNATATDAEQLTTVEYGVFDSMAPTLYFMAYQSGPGEITISGSVDDEFPAGLTVNLQGAVNDSVQTDEYGIFHYVTSAFGPDDITASVNDYWGLGSDPWTEEISNEAPTISNFYAIDQGYNIWTFEGYVDDEFAEGLAVQLGGIPSLNNVTTTVGMYGYFSITVELSPGETGTAWARTTDWLGADSNTAMDFVN